MAHVDNQRAQEGVIRSHIDLAEAAANGSRGMVDFLLDNGMQIDTPGKDGTTPLCAAALWGNDAMVAFLLDKGADVSARNEGMLVLLLLHVVFVLGRLADVHYLAVRHGVDSSTCGIFSRARKSCTYSLGPQS